MTEATVGIWAQIVGTILQVLNLIPKDKTRRSRHQEQTLQAISKAYHSTEKYYAYLEAGNTRNRQMEYDIAQEWESASIFVHDYDINLAQRLGIKSRYWREGGAWSGDIVKQAGIQLERVRVEGMTLFEKKVKIRVSPRIKN